MVPRHAQPRRTRLMQPAPPPLWRTGVMAAGGGLLLAASVAWPLPNSWFAPIAQGTAFWWLQPLALALLCQGLQQSHSLRQAWWTGWVFATTWLAATFWWLVVAMHVYGGMNAPLAVFATLLLAAALALYYALAGLVFWQWTRVKGFARGAYPPAPASSLLFAALWTMAEMARGTWLTGFGWGAVGYAHVDGPLAFYAPWLGTYGLTALGAWLAAVLAQKLRLRWAVAALTLLGLPLVLSVPDWTQSTGQLRVSLLQGNVSQSNKFDAPTVAHSLRWYAQGINAAQGALVVVPETAIPLLPADWPPGYLDSLQASLRSKNQSALIGTPWGDAQNGYTNAALGLGGGEPAGYRYDKHHLVPFGEFIPPLFHWFIDLMQIPLGDFNRGPLAAPSFVAQGQRLGPHICYEDLFGEELATRFTDPARAPTILVNLSNLGWFDDTVAVDQHATIARMRALELQRPIVRATNTGLTAIIDHQGHVVSALPRLQVGVLEGRVEGRTGTTPVAWWAGRFGLWPVWLLCGLVLGGYWMRRRP